VLREGLLAPGNSAANGLLRRFVKKLRANHGISQGSFSFFRRIIGFYA
jgi:hypothetical protein